MQKDFYPPNMMLWDLEDDEFRESSRPGANLIHDRDEVRRDTRYVGSSSEENFFQKLAERFTDIFGAKMQL